jgi:hypothetical protein
MGMLVRLGVGSTCVTFEGAAVNPGHLADGVAVCSLLGDCCRIREELCAVTRAFT